MTEQQMVAALKSVGAIFAISTAKYIAASDPWGSKPAYHIHPDADNPRVEDVERVYSQSQLMDWVRTAKAAGRAPDEKAFELWEAYAARWEDK